METAQSSEDKNSQLKEGPVDSNHKDKATPNKQKQTKRSAPRYTFSLYPSKFWITSGAIQNGVPTKVWHVSSIRALVDSNHKTREKN